MLDPVEDMATQGTSTDSLTLGQVKAHTAAQPKQKVIIDTMRRSRLTNVPPRFSSLITGTTIRIRCSLSSRSSIHMSR